MKVVMRCGDLAYTHDVIAVEKTHNGGWRLTLYSGGYKYYSKSYDCAVIDSAD